MFFPRRPTVWSGCEWKTVSGCSVFSLRICFSALPKLSNGEATDPILGTLLLFLVAWKQNTKLTHKGRGLFFFNTDLENSGNTELGRKGLSQPRKLVDFIDNGPGTVANAVQKHIFSRILQEANAF